MLVIGKQVLLILSMYLKFQILGCFALSGSSGILLIQTTRMTFASILIGQWMITLIGGNFKALQSIQYDLQKIFEPSQSSFFNKVCNTHWVPMLVVSGKSYIS